MQSTNSPYRPFKGIGISRFVLFLAITFCLVDQRVNALENGTEPLTMEADRITYQDNPQQVTAEGGVVLRHQDKASDVPLLLGADSVSYTVEKSQVDAQGNVILKEKSGTVTASGIQLNIEDRTGKLTDTAITLADQELMFNGKLAEKTGGARYIFYDGRVTSCRTTGDEAPDWSINWSKADITVDGLAFLKHATFRVKNAPLFYIPYLILPAKTTRQTGFLFPELSHSSRDGAALIAPLFINLSPSSDLTYYPGYYEKRGVFSGLELRRVFGRDSKLTLTANYQHDKTEDQGPPGSDDDYRKDGFLRTEHDRYWLRGKADHVFSQGLALHLDIDTVSDQDYLYEYRNGLTGFNKSNLNFLNEFNRGLQEATLNFRESILQLAGHGEQSGGGLEIRYADNTIEDYTGDEAIQTLPRARFDSRQPLDGLPMSFDWGSEYVYYRPEEGIGYHRLDLRPSLIMPIPLGPLVEGTFIGGLRETAYRIETIGDPAVGWGSADSKNRNSLNFAANIATILARDFQITDEQLLTHTFRPNLRYSYLEHGDQSDLPNLDNGDRLDDNNGFTVELNNYFHSTKFVKGQRSDRQIGYLKLIQSYDLSEARRDLTIPGDKRRPLSDLALDLEISPLDRLYFRYQTALNVYGGGISRYKLQGLYSNDRKDNFSIDYDYVKGTTRNINLSSRLRLTDNLSVGFSTTRSLLEDHTSDETASLHYYSQCWEMELASVNDSEDRRVILTFSLTGIGKTLEVGKSGV